VDHPAVDWDTLQVGDPDPGLGLGPCCRALAPEPWPPYLCSRDPHETGQHVASDGVTVLAVWPVDGAL
jgi:hypothetical protein